MTKYCYKSIMNFINRRWRSSDANWTTGNCYWFAFILITRFPELKIYYLPILGHFIAGNDNKYFDATGEVFPEETPILFIDILKTDPLYANRLLRDCRD